MLRYPEIGAVGLVIGVVSWLDAPRLLVPAFVVAVIVSSADRWHCGIWPWPPRRTS